jgi:hypothetical protein
MSVNINKYRKLLYTLLKYSKNKLIYNIEIAFIIYLTYNHKLYWSLVYNIIYNLTNKYLFL